MGHHTERSVERVIEAMRENLGETLTIDEMARIAMFSKFHFSRVFRDSTGMSPGRFLCALRLQKAKHLLATTSLSVSDVSNMVGYSSIGTFSSRFKSAVGVAPSVFRTTGDVTPSSRRNGRRPSLAESPVSIRGRVTMLGKPCDSAYVGLFPNAIPQGSPVRCAALSGSDSFVIDATPPGTWHLLAYARVPRSMAIACTETDLAADETITCVGAHGPITIAEDRPEIISVEVSLRPAGALDPPVLLAPATPV
jgi:AraC-like DNA-binding protein